MIVGLLFSVMAAAEEHAAESFSFFTTHEQRMRIDANMVSKYNSASKKIKNLGYVGNQNGVRLLLSDGSIVRLKRASINKVYKLRKTTVINIVKTLE